MSYTDMFEQNIFNPVDGKLQDIIDVFVSYYGEEYRDKITSNLQGSTMLFVNHMTQDDAIEYYSNYYDHQSAKVVSRAIFGNNKSNFQNLDISIDEFCNLVRCIKKLRITTAQCENIYKLIKAYNLDDLGQITDANNFAQIFSFLSEPEHLEKLNHCNKKALQRFYGKHIKKYNYYQEEKNKAINNFIKIKQGEEDIKNSVAYATKYILANYLKKITGATSQEDLNRYSKIMDSLLRRGKEFFRVGIVIPSVLSKKYKEFYKFLGFEDVKRSNSTELENIIFNEEIFNEWSKLTKKCNRLLLSNNPFFMESLEKITKLPIKGGNLGFVEAVHDYIFALSGQTAYVHYYVDKNTNTLKNILVCEESIVNNDAVLFHELNHAATATLLKSHSTGYTLKRGVGYLEHMYNGNEFTSLETLCLDLGDFDLDEDEQKEDGSKASNHEFLNEIVNDYLALQIVEIAHKNGLKLYHGSKFTSAYSVCFVVFENLLKDNIEQIKKCTICEDANALEKFLGKENFETVTAIANKLKDNYVTNIKQIKEVAKEIKTKLGLAGDGNIRTYTDNIRMYKNLHMDWSDEFNELYSMCEQVDKINEQIKSRNALKNTQKLQKNKIDATERNI